MKKIDAHMHVSDGGQRFVGCDVDSVIDAVDRIEIDQLACSIPIIGGRWPTPDEVRACDDGLLDAMRRYPQRILGYCFLNPGYAREALAELDRCVIRERMIGVKLYNQYKINDPVVFPIIERTIELGVPILVHAARLVTAADIASQPLTSHAADFIDVGRRYPEAIIIEGHIAGGGGSWEWTLKVLRDAPKSIYLDTSGSVMDAGLRACPEADIIVLEAIGVESSVFVTDPALANARVYFEFSRMATVLQRTIPALLNQLGARRLLFGTGMPLKIPGPALLKLELLEAPAEVKAALASENIARLLNERQP